MFEWILLFITILLTTLFFKVVRLPNQKYKKYYNLLLILGFGFRIICIFLPPIWEDDWARYLWEGDLIRNHISPYEFPPIYFFPNSNLDSFSKELLSKINHPEWTTIYSPFVLFYFSIFTYSFSVFFLKCSYLLFESVCFFLFSKHNRKSPVILYWIYPILVKEVYINMHFEIILLFFFWIFSYYLKSKMIFRSGFVFGILVHTKFIAMIYGILFLPYFWIRNLKQRGILFVSIFVSFTFGFFIFYLIYLILYPNSSDFGFNNLQRFGESFYFNQFFEPFWKYFFTINLRSFPFFSQLILLYFYLYLLLPKKNRKIRFILLSRKYHFYFYIGYFALTLFPILNPWYFLILIPIITISRSKSVLPWILISILQVSYLTNVRLNLPSLYFYQISDPILLFEALVSVICIFLYFYQIFILLYKISNISNIASKG
ncbi:hypothetical protein AB3N60_13025 [Leptospira sp. WS39.C2]